MTYLVTDNRTVMKFATKQKNRCNLIALQTIFKRQTTNLNTEFTWIKYKQIHIFVIVCIYPVWITAILLEQSHQTQLSRDKKQIKESHLGGSPLFDMVRVTGLENLGAFFLTFSNFD